MVAPIRAHALAMTTLGLIKLCAILAGMFLFSQSGPTRAQAVPANKQAQDNASQHDGQHDFDFLIGAWNIHLKRLVHHLSASHEWIELDGTTVCKSLFDGRAEIEEMNVDRWSIWWANAKDGAISPPPVIGEFKN